MNRVMPTFAKKSTGSSWLDVVDSFFIPETAPAESTKVNTESNIPADPVFTGKEISLESITQYFKSDTMQIIVILGLVLLIKELM